MSSPTVLDRPRLAKTARGAAKSSTPRPTPQAAHPSPGPTASRVVHADRGGPSLRVWERLVTVDKNSPQRRRVMRAFWLLLCILLVAISTYLRSPS
jgi:hypothetical protein